MGLMPSSTAPNWLLPKHSQKLMQPNTPPRMAPLAGPMTMAPTITGTISRVISSPGILIMPSPVTSSSSIMATSTEMRTRSCTVYFPCFVSLFIIITSCCRLRPAECGARTYDTTFSRFCNS